MQPGLKAQGFAAGRDRIGRLREELGLRCKKRNFETKTDLCHDFPVAPNLLEQPFEPTTPTSNRLSISLMCRLVRAGHALLA